MDSSAFIRALLEVVLAPGIRNRFTEVVVDEMTSAEYLRPLIREYLALLALPAATIAGILAFYTAARTAAAATSLVSGEGRRPTFSLRTLCRALKVAARNPCGGVRRSLLEGYILTEQVRRNLGDLCRIVSLCDHPVLLQGDTSVGKTSLVTHLARLTGNSCVRVRVFKFIEFSSMFLQSSR